IMSLAHITHGEALTNTTLSRTFPGALTRAFISEWMHPQLPGTEESHLLGRPRALPLYPIARTFSRAWSVMTVPTCSRPHVERLANSSAIRIYTSYKGIRVTDAGDAAVDPRFKGCVFASTPSLKRLKGSPDRDRNRRSGRGRAAGRARCRSRRGRGRWSAPAARRRSWRGSRRSRS